MFMRNGVEFCNTFRIQDEDVFYTFVFLSVFLQILTVTFFAVDVLFSSGCSSNSFMFNSFCATQYVHKVFHALFWNVQVYLCKCSPWVQLTVTFMESHFPFAFNPACVPLHVHWRNVCVTFLWLWIVAVLLHFIVFEFGCICTCIMFCSFSLCLCSITLSMQLCKGIVIHI